jgi:hypothetical protein
VIFLSLFQINFVSFFAVPIIPEFLYDIRHPDAPLSSLGRHPPPIIAAPDNEESTTNGYGE